MFDFVQHDHDLPDHMTITHGRLQAQDRVVYVVGFCPDLGIARFSVFVPALRSDIAHTCCRETTLNLNTGRAEESLFYYGERQPK